MVFDASRWLDPAVLDLARNRGFSDFTEVQQKAFPKIASGKSVLLMAPTGFGKTEAAMLPILSKLVSEKNDGVQCLYITPLRALNRDMLLRMDFFCKMLGLRLGVRHGDTTSYERVKQKERPPNILITTPESLNALLVAGMRDSLTRVRYVVVDEVHELVYSKRGLQLSAALGRLALLSEHQVIGLSATVAAPLDVAAFFGSNVSVVDCSHLRSLDLSVEFPRSGPAMAGINPDTAARVHRLSVLIQTHQKTLVFVNTRFMAEALGALLRPLLGNAFAVHHSSLSREARLETEEAFKKGELRALVCTSSLELGMDIGEVDLVIQVGSPRQVARLVQRVGRSGHKSHLTPKGVILAQDSLDEAEARVLVGLAHAGRLEKHALRPLPLDVLAHQICGLLMEYGRIRLDGAVKVLRGHAFSSSLPPQPGGVVSAGPFCLLTLSVARRVVEQLASQGTLAFDGDFLEATKRTRFYYYENLSTIADLKKFFVKNAETRKNVALLDDAFVSNYLAPGVSFIARGRAWRVLSLSEDELVVEPSNDVSAAIPDWVGEEIPVASAVAASVCRALPGCALGKKQALFFEPALARFDVECHKAACVIHSFLGHKANEALARMLAFSFSAKGKSVRARAGAYFVLLEFSKEVDAHAVCGVLHSLKGVDVERFLRARLIDSPLFSGRFVHVAKRFGFLRKDRDYRAMSVRRLAASMVGSVICDEVFSELFYEKLDCLAAQNALALFSTRAHFFDSFSPLAKEAIALGGFSELVAAAEPTETVVAAFAGELLAKKVLLHCGYCNQRFSKLLKDVGQVACLYCASPQVFPEAYSGKKDQARVMALVVAYGKKALLALSTYGVGPEGAVRVLSRLHKTDSDFYYDLLQGQKDFIRTKRFWSA